MREDQAIEHDRTKDDAGSIEDLDEACLMHYHARREEDAKGGVKP